jgi:glycerol-3-phosphate dehydrogenase
VERTPARLADEPFDVLIVGGGVFGAALARDAAQRGLRTALVEKGDFGSGASANSFRMVHGGIRYLQHLDVARVRHSARERAVLLATAPHAVRPLPVVMPARGRGARGRALLGAGFLTYDLLTRDLNRLIHDRSQRIPASRLMSRDRVLELFPDLPADGLTGAGLFHDAQMQHPVRLIVAMLQDAHREGAALASYLEATHLLREGDRVVGARVVDAETSDAFDVRARVVVLCAGGWTDRLLAGASAAKRPHRPAAFSRDLCLVTDLAAPHGYALAVPGGGRDADALLSRSGRHLFIVPWLGRVIVGVWHRDYEEGPDDLRVDEREIDSFVGEIQGAYPALGLTRERVVAYNTGLVLLDAAGGAGGETSFGKRSRLIDHRRDGVRGLVSLLGVRYTTARHDAARALDLAVDQLDAGFAPCRTDRTPIFGGALESVRSLRAEVASAWPGQEDDVVDAICRCYGAAHATVLARAEALPGGAVRLPGSHVLAAEVVHAIREEAALHLDDVVLRRTELGLLGPPPAPALDAASRIMAAELGWSEPRRLAERDRASRASGGPGLLLSSPPGSG